MSSEPDFDQFLLQQFSCMGTTDKDELVKQFQAIVGFNLNSRNAQFFLEMNNWNLQGAVGSYFDTNNSFNLPSMTLLRNYLCAEEETKVHPCTSFFKTYQVQNPGEEPWPEGCYLAFAGGCMMAVQEHIPALRLMPGCQTTIRIDMIAPQVPGVYQSKWRMSTGTGAYFGDVIWVIVTVFDETLNGLTQQLSSLSSLGSQIQQSHTNSSLNTNANATRPTINLDIEPPTMDDDCNALL